MKNYFIHIDDDFAEAEVFLYPDSAPNHHANVDIDEIKSFVDPNSKVIVFLPSNMIRYFHSKKESSESKEQFQARFFSEHEDDFITDVSSNYLISSEDKSLAMVIERSIIDPLNELLNQIGCDVDIYPEHFLHQASNEDTCLLIKARYSFSFSDGSGFCVYKNNFHDYLDRVKEERKNFKPIFMASDLIAEKEFKKSDWKDVSLESLHQDFIRSNSITTNLPSIFESKFTLQGTLRKFNFERRDLIYSLIILSSLLITPLLNIALMQNYKKTYQERTFSIFRELNPNFRRIINPKVQMDELLAAINPDGAESLDLDILSYFRLIPIDDIASSKIDFQNLEISLEIDKISASKYSIIETLIQQSNAKIIENNIESKEGNFSGSLLLEVHSD